MLSGVRELGYQHRHGAKSAQPAQVHLRIVRHELSKLLPDMKILVSGAGQSLPLVPWIAILDPDVTQTAQKGTYAVYLYEFDLSRVYLSANQGSTQHLDNAKASGLQNRAAELAALEALQGETKLLTAGVGDILRERLLQNIDLGAPPRFLPQGYEAGNIGSIEYDLTQLPSDRVLHDDLQQILHLNDRIVLVKKDILARDPGAISTAAVATKTPTAPPPPVFKPKDASDYRAEVKAQVQKKTRRHEALLTEFSRWTSTRGLTAANNVHPRDLTIDGDDMHWLVEAKTVPINAERAARDSIGQLFSYRHFYYREAGRADPLLVALFSEPIGEAFAILLGTLSVESIWWDGHDWAGYAPDNATSLRLIALHNSP